MNSRRNCDPQAGRPRGPRPSIFFTAVIYPVVKVRRRSGSTGLKPELPVVPACPLVGGLLGERTDQGICHGSRHASTVRGPSCEPSSVAVWIRCLGMPRGIQLCLWRTDRDQLGGGDEETRTPDPLLAKEMLCQLSYVPVTFGLREVVGAPGLEPGTSALSGPRSNQLSYAP